MSTKKHKSIEKVIDRVADVQSSESIEDCEEAKKVSISFHKITLSILEETKKDLEEIIGYTSCGMREAMGMVLDLGSLTYKAMKERRKVEYGKIGKKVKKKKKEGE